MAQRHRSVEDFEAHLDLAARSAMVVFTDFAVFKRCGVAPIGGFMHVSCDCVCGPDATFCSEGWDMVARKHGTTRTAFAGTATGRLFGSWSEIVCPSEAYKLVQSFVVDLWRFANAGTEVAELVRINPVAPQPVTGSAGTAAFDSPVLSSPYSSSGGGSSGSSSSVPAERRAACVASHAGIASHGGTAPTRVASPVLPTWTSMPASAPPPTASEFGATLPWSKVRSSPQQPATAPSMVSAAVTRERKRPNQKAAAETSIAGAKQGKYDDGVEYIVID